MFFENTQCSGVVPQIAAIMGACTGGGVYSPAIMDFIVQVKGTAQMFITGPRVIQEVSGEEISFEKLIEYKEAILSPYYSASKHCIDGVIHNRDTRRWLIWAMDVFKDKRPETSLWKKHGNIPL